MGTTGNAAWAEGVGASVAEPAEALKALGYSLNEIPTSEEFNWALQNTGRSVVRRHNASLDLINQQRAGLVAPSSYEDVGLVLPNIGSAPAALYSVLWAQDTTDLLETEIVCDGEWLWSTFDPALAKRIRRRSRSTGAISLDQPAGSFDYPFLATSGGSVYTADDIAGTGQLYAWDRVTLAPLHTIALPAVAVVRALATDGKYVAVAAGNFLRLYQDTGAAFVLIGSYDHTAQVNSVAMDGRYIIIGGVTPGGGPPHNQIRILDYTATLYQSLSRTGNPQVLRLAFDGEAVVYEGDTDAGNEVGYYRSQHGTLRWEGAVAANDVLLHEGMLVEAHDGSIVWRDPVDGEYITLILWGEASTNVWRIVHDHDGFFALGEKDGVVNRIKRYAIQNTPRLYAVVPKSEILGGSYAGPVHALIRPADQRPR